MLLLCFLGPWAGRWHFWGLPLGCLPSGQHHEKWFSCILSLLSDTSPAFIQGLVVVHLHLFSHKFTFVTCWQLLGWIRTSAASVFGQGHKLQALLVYDILPSTQYLEEGAGKWCSEYGRDGHKFQALVYDILPSTQYLEEGAGKWCSECGRGGHKFQALVYDILPSTTAVFGYALRSRKMLAKEQFW